MFLISSMGSADAIEDTVARTNTVQFAEVGIAYELSTEDELVGSPVILSTDFSKRYELHGEKRRLTLKNPSPVNVGRAEDTDKMVLANQMSKPVEFDVFLPLGLTNRMRATRAVKLAGRVEAPGFDIEIQDKSIRIQIGGETLELGVGEIATYEGAAITVPVRTLEVSDEPVDGELPRWKRANKTVEQTETVLARPTITVRYHGTLSVSTGK